MSLRDRFGRLLSRLRATQPSVVERQRAAVDARLAKFSGHARQVAAAERQQRQNKQRLADLGITPVDRETAQEIREARLRELGVEPTNIFEPDFIPTGPPDEGESEKGPGVWIRVASSNVKMIRYVGGVYGLEVIFLNGYWYGYEGDFSLFKSMLESGSKGSFVWHMRNTGVPYVRYDPTTIPPRIIYTFGRTGISRTQRYETGWRPATSGAQ